MKLRTTLLGVLAAALPLGAFADNHEVAAPALSDVWVLAVNANSQEKFNEAMAEHMAWRKEAGDSRNWQAYRVAIGDKMNRIMYRADMSGWGDLDAYREESEENGYGEHFGKTVGPHVDHFHHWIDEYDHDNSYWTDGPKGPYFGVTTWWLDESFNPQAYAARIKLSQTGMDGWASEDNQWLWITNTGGRTMLSIVSPFASYADMEEPEVTFFQFINEKLGEEEAAKLFSDFSAGKVKSDFTVWEHAADISTPSDE